MELAVHIHVLCLCAQVDGVQGLHSSRPRAKTRSTSGQQRLPLPPTHGSVPATVANDGVHMLRTAYRHVPSISCLARQGLGGRTPGTRCGNTSGVATPMREHGAPGANRCARRNRAAHTACRRNKARVANPTAAWRAILQRIGWRSFQLKAERRRLPALQWLQGGVGHPVW